MSRPNGNWSITFDYPTKEFIELNQNKYGPDWRLAKLLLSGRIAWVIYWETSKDLLRVYLDHMYRGCKIQQITQEDIQKFDLAKYSRLD